VRSNDALSIVTGHALMHPARLGLLPLELHKSATHKRSPSSTEHPAPRRTGTHALLRDARVVQQAHRREDDVVQDQTAHAQRDVWREVNRGPAEVRGWCVCVDS